MMIKNVVGMHYVASIARTVLIYARYATIYTTMTSRLHTQLLCCFFAKSILTNMTESFLEFKMIEKTKHPLKFER